MVPQQLLSFLFLLPFITLRSKQQEQWQFYNDGCCTAMFNFVKGLKFVINCLHHAGQSTDLLYIL